MNADKKCQDITFRLCVYEAGHAITAYLLEQKIVSIQMLPRPPMMMAEKAFRSHNWDSFIETLENRCLELFGGQIAEQFVCGTTACCAGDISRIDEITRILEALYSEDDLDSEDILFELEDRTETMLAPQEVRDAILPIAEFLYAEEESGKSEVDGKDITRLLEQLIPRPEKESRGLLDMLKRA